MLAGSHRPEVVRRFSKGCQLPRELSSQVQTLAAKLEAPFAAAEYDGEPAAPEFTWFRQAGRVLISAPHAVNHLRSGRMKDADRYTGAIGLAVSDLAGQPFLARTRGPAGDPNWDEISPYKDAITAAARRGEIRCVVDLHGAARGHPFDAALGTAGASGDYLPDAVACLAGAGLGEVMTDGRYFGARHPGTVTWHAAHRLGLPAVQIEINGFYRNPERRPIAFWQAVTGVAALVDLLSRRFP